MVLAGLSASAVVDDRLTLRPCSDLDRSGGLDARRGVVAGPRIVSLHGEHDCSTADDLVALLSDAIALDDADLVVDLRDVTFIGASTLGVLVRIHSTLGVQGRILALRSPSSLARRVLDICGLNDLVEVSPGASPSVASKAS